MIVYISGAITNDKHYRRKFAKAEKRLRKRGFEVINPAKIGDLMPKSFSHRDYMDIDLELLKKADAIYMLKGWHFSIGATVEFMYAGYWKKKLMG
jgi:hypothetical protein